MEWITNHWAEIIIYVGIFCAICFAVKKYTDKTPTEKDNWLGNALGWFAGLLKAIFGVFKKDQ